jgi:hypothetical protein
MAVRWQVEAPHSSRNKLQPMEQHVGNSRGNEPISQTIVVGPVKDDDTMRMGRLMLVTIKYGSHYDILLHRLPGMRIGQCQVTMMRWFTWLDGKIIFLVEQHPPPPQQLVTMANNSNAVVGDDGHGWNVEIDSGGSFNKFHDSCPKPVYIQQCF